MITRGLVESGTGTGTNTKRYQEPPYFASDPMALQCSLIPFLHAVSGIPKELPARRIGRRKMMVVE